VQQVAAQMIKSVVKKSMTTDYGKKAAVAKSATARCTIRDAILSLTLWGMDGILCLDI